MIHQISYGIFENIEIQFDTIRMKKGEELKINKRIYLFSTDTTIFVKQGTKYKVKPATSDSFYYKIAAESEKYRITRELYNFIFVNNSDNNTSDSAITTLNPKSYIEYSGKTIRFIKIHRLSVFGTSISDTLLQPNRWIDKTANSIHTKTREYLIRNNLLFTEGDRLNVLVLSDNERILRQLPYIEDARIIVKPLTDNSDMVDIVVITRDIWALAFDVKLNNSNSGQVEVWQRNLFGLGQDLQNNVIWDTRKNPTTGFENIYKINNIAGSFFNSTFNYYNGFETKTFGVNFIRNFLTPNVKYAAGVSMFHYETIVPEKIDTSINYIPLNYNKYDYWIGRSFQINSGDISKMRSNITFSTRIVRDFFIQRPNIQINSYYDYQDKTLFLTSLSYTRQSFFKSNYIYNFGRTEDIALGSEISLVSGFEKNEFRNRYYGGVTIANGNYGNYGYLLSNCKIGSFYTKDGEPQQSVFESKLEYFTPLYVFNRFSIRQFAKIRYTQGANRFLNEYLTINNNIGLTGFTNDSLLGSKRIDMHWETVGFTPWHLLDFKIVTFLSADHVWFGNKQMFQNKKPYTAVNFGFRVRNEHLVFKTFQIRFTIYPNVPPGVLSSLVNVSNEQVLNTYNFAPKYPEIFEYR